MESWRVELAAYYLEDQRRINQGLFACWEGVVEELKVSGLDTEPYVREVEQLKSNIDAAMENITSLEVALRGER